MVSCAYYPFHYTRMHCIIVLGNNETMIAREFSYPFGKMYWGDLVPCIAQNSTLISQLNIVIRLIQRRKKVFALKFQQSTTIRKIIHTLMPGSVSLLLVVSLYVIKSQISERHKEVFLRSSPFSLYCPSRGSAEKIIRYATYTV